MKVPARTTAPDLGALLKLFPSRDDLADFQIVPAERLPTPYHALLVHEHHMTVTVEKYHGDLVNVCILDRRRDGDTYARKILLTLQKTGQVVQYGVMRIHLRYCSDEVKQQILAGQTPLGRILIEHNVLRRIEPTAFLRVVPGPAMRQWFGLPKTEPTFGRLAIIHCDDRPAVELLEIVAPVTAPRLKS